MNREQKEAQLIATLNKASASAKSFFLFHLGQYATESGKVREVIMRMNDDEFKTFYEEEIDNLKAGLGE